MKHFSTWMSEQRSAKKANLVLGHDEGAICNRDGCEGVMRFKTPDDCSCHISPPCTSCVESNLRCDDCGAFHGDDE